MPPLRREVPSQSALGLQGPDAVPLYSYSVGNDGPPWPALNRPASLLPLYEPFLASDAPLRARLRHDFLALQPKCTSTTTLVTPGPMEAASPADKLRASGDGRVPQSGPVNQEFMYPANEKVARPVRADNLAEVVVATVEHDIFNGGGVQAFEFSTGKSRTIPSRVMV